MNVSIAASLLAALVAFESRAQESRPPLEAGMGPVHFLRYSPRGDELVRICSFGGVERFATADFRRVRTFDVGMRMVAFSPDGSLLGSAEGTDGARLWDAADEGKPVEAEATEDAPEVHVVEIPRTALLPPSRDKTRRVFWCEFSPDGKHLATAHANGRVNVWIVETGALAQEIAVTEREVRALAFAPDSRFVVFGDVDGVVHEWDLGEKKEVRKTPGSGAITQVLFTPDGKTLITAHSSKSGASVVFRDRDHEVVEAKDGFGTVAISKSGAAIALGGRVVEFVYPATRNLKGVPLGNPNDPATVREAPPPTASANRQVVTALAFSPDGKTLAIGLFDGKVQFIEVHG